MELQPSTVLVTGATGNTSPYVTTQLVEQNTDVVETDLSMADDPDGIDHIIGLAGDFE